jgi:Peptidase family M28
MKGQHDPVDYAASVVIDDHEDIICALRTEVNADSLRSHLEHIVSFGTRHTYSDTVSANVGIGAARRWVYGKLQHYSTLNEGRLLPAYLQFDYFNEAGGCGDGQGWRNVLAVLPGSQTAGHRVIIIEAHLDSRCADNCDPNCAAQGAEDNGSGSALVLELARVMSKYTFKHTLVFMLVTGEEHGLLGSRAMAQFCSAQNIAIKGVLNNDIVGGILCGETASPPGCGIVNEVDSLQLRIFSHGTTRGLARTTAISYNEKLDEHVPVPMLISVMDREDRVGRGSDHIPFRESGYQSVRFTAANEHGDGDPSVEGYDDRQHTSDDILGIDTNGDALIDSFFVDFNYLARNAVINGMEATLLAHGPETPTYSVIDEPMGLRVEIDAGPEWVAYRIGVRPLNGPPAFAALYRTSLPIYQVPGLSAAEVYYVSVAGVDAQGITSIFGPEVVRSNDAETPPAAIDDLPYGLDCLPIGLDELGRSVPLASTLECMPNPFSGITTIRVRPGHGPQGQGWLIIRDIFGRAVDRLPVMVTKEGATVEYEHHHLPGLYAVELVVNGEQVDVLRVLAMQ